MRRTVIIFDGEEHYEIGTQYFFQHPVIESLKPGQVVDMYQSTAIYASVIEDVDSLIKNGIIYNINDSVVSPDYCKRVRDGLYILEGMVMDLFGDDGGMEIIKATNAKINEVD